METQTSARVPSLCRHKATGQAYIYVAGRRTYLGRYDDPQTPLKYHRAVAELLAGGGPAEAPPAEVIPIHEVVRRFWVWANSYYTNSDGTNSQELVKFKYAFRLLLQFYGDVPAEKFGPKALVALRQQMISHGWCRAQVNRNVQIIKGLFRWATEQELVSGEVFHALQAVVGLRRGRCGVRDTDPVRAVPVEQVNAIKDFVSQPVWGLIQLQLYTGARSGELLQLRPMDIDQSTDVWTYTPATHKTAHHGHCRTIYFGPRAKEVLQPFLQREPDRYLFSPQEAEAERRAKLHAERSTPLSCGHRPGNNRKALPAKAAGEFYDVASYRRAIAYACDHAFPLPEHLARLNVPRADGKRGVRLESAEQWQRRLGPEKWKQVLQWRKQHRWHPHQLRHSAATELRRQFGLEAARVVLGHRSAAVTELYAEMDRAKAMSAILQAG